MCTGTQVCGHDAHLHNFLNCTTMAPAGMGALLQYSCPHGTPRRCGTLLVASRSMCSPHDDYGSPRNPVLAPPRQLQRQCHGEVVLAQNSNLRTAFRGGEARGVKKTVIEVERTRRNRVHARASQSSG